MSKLERKPFFETGKLQPFKLQKIILDRIGNNKSAIGPSVGTDFGLTDSGLIMTTDPLSCHRPLGMEFAAKFGFSIILTDFLASGNTPEFMSVSLQLPATMTDEELEKYWESFTREAKKWEIDLVTGHTGRYPSASFPLIGSCTMVGRAVKEPMNYNKVSEGDSILIMGFPGIQASVILSFYGKGRDMELMGNLKEMKENLIITQPMKSLIDNFGPHIRVMHDVTEGGLNSSLFEIARASSREIRVEKNKIPSHKIINQYLSSLELDPFSVTSEGCIVLITEKDVSEDIMNFIIKLGYPCSIAGHVGGKGGNHAFIDNKVLGEPGSDPYWGAILK